LAYHHGNLRQALIDGAKALIADQGPDGFTLRELARRVGVSHNASYRHFADKEALLAAVAEQGFISLGASFAAQMQPGTSSVDTFAAAGQAYVLWALENPSSFRVMFRMTDAGERYPSLRVAGMAAFQVLLDLVTAAQAEGAVGPGDPKLLALTAWSTVHGLARLMVDGAIPLEELPDPETSARMVTQTLMNGLETGLP
jgi:AcrR family transcriptional regulator